MPKRKRNAPKKSLAVALWKSIDLPQELWEQIVSALDLPCLVICGSLAKANTDHWFCFYVKRLLPKKKLLAIRRALYRISVPHYTRRQTKGFPDHAKNLLKCFSKACPPSVLPHAISDAIGSDVPLFKIQGPNLRKIPGGFEIQGLGDQPRYKWGDDRKAAGFIVSIKIMLPIHVGNNKFSPKDYTIRIYQINNQAKKFHPIGYLLFSFFKKFRFTVILYGSTTWTHGPTEPWSRGPKKSVLSFEVMQRN